MIGGTLSIERPLFVRPLIFSGISFEFLEPASLFDGAFDGNFPSETISGINYRQFDSLDLTVVFWPTRPSASLNLY